MLLQRKFKYETFFEWFSNTVLYKEMRSITLKVRLLCLVLSCHMRRCSAVVLVQYGKKSGVGYSLRQAVWVPHEFVIRLKTQYFQKSDDFFMKEPNQPFSQLLIVDKMTTLFWLVKLPDSCQIWVTKWSDWSIKTAHEFDRRP